MHSYLNIRCQEAARFKKSKNRGNVFGHCLSWLETTDRQRSLCSKLHSLQTE